MPFTSDGKWFPSQYLKPKKENEIENERKLLLPQKQQQASKKSIDNLLSKLPKKEDTYKVVKGDYLIKIADKLGVNDWHDIYKANKNVIGKNPDLIYPDQVFKIPHKTVEKVDNQQSKGSFLDNIKQRKADEKAGNHDSSWITDYKPRSWRHQEQAEQPDFASLEAQSIQGVKTVKPPIPDFTTLEAKSMKGVTKPKDEGFSFIEDLIKPAEQKLLRTSAGINEILFGSNPLEDQVKYNGDTLPDKFKQAAKPAETTGDKIAEGLGNVLGYGVAYGQGGKAAQTGFTKLMSLLNSLPKGKAAQLGLKAAERFATGAGAGMQAQTAQELADTEQQAFTDRLTDIAKEGALFGAMDAGLYGAGAAVGKGLKATGIPQKIALAKELNKAKPEVKDPLDLILNRPAAIHEAKPITQVIEDLKRKPNQGPLSQGKFKVSNPASKQLDELFQIAQERGLPPGREYEYLQNLWAEIAPPTAGTLDDLIEAASREITTGDMIKAGAKNMQQAKDAQKFGVYQPLNLGIDQLTKTTKQVDPYPTFKGTKDIFNLNLPKKEVKPLEELLPVVKKQTPKIQLPQVNKMDEAATTLDETLLRPTPETQKPILNNEKERGFIETLRESPKSSPSFLERLKGPYQPITNAETVEQANRRVAHDIDAAEGYVIGAKDATPEHVATAFRLIDEFQKAGNYERAVNVAEKIAELGTKAGQSVQAFSIYNRLSPEGILIHAQRTAARVNERLRPGQAPVKVTNEMAAQLTDLATTVRTMEGANQSAKNVLNLMEKAKTGQKLTPEELREVQQFAQEARNVIDNHMPKPKKKLSVPKEPAIRKQVMSFLEEQEKAARERIASRKGRLNSLPVDELADYAIIGATKMGKGAIKFSVWSEQMVKEFGENIRPHLAEIYDKAVETIDSHVTSIKRAKLSEVEKITNRAVRAAEIDPADAENLKKMAMEIAKLTGEQKIEAMQELQATLQLIEKPTILQKISSLQTQAQLLNPKTLLTRNPLGNELFYRLERMNKYLSTPIDWTRSKITGGQRTVTFHTAGQGGYWKGFFKGVKAGWKGVNVNGLETQFDLRGPAFRGKWNPLTYTEKALGAALRGFDNAAYERAVNQTIGELATLRVINEGLTGQAKKEAIQRYMHQLDENGLAIAQEYGKYITFQDNNLLSMMLQKTKHGLNSLNQFVGVKDTSWGLGDVILKYPKTPGALVMRALEYSPAGFLRGLYVASLPFIRKGVEKNTREATEAIARSITGSMGITGLGWFLADMGILTGSAEDDYEIKALQRAIGEGDFKINLTAMKRFVLSGWNPSAAKPQRGDTFVSYDWMQPVAISMSVGANISQNIQQNKDPLANADSVARESIFGGFTTIAQQPVLEGITKPFRGYDLQESFTQTAKDIPASFVPTFLNQIRQLSDNTGHVTYDPSDAQETINKMKYKVPGLSDNLPVSYDTLGRPKEVYQDGSNNLFNVFLNPAFVSEYNPTKEEELLVDLYQRTGEKKIAPRIPQKTLRIDGKSIELTPEQWSRLQQLVGEETMKRLGPVNPNASDEAKIKRIMNILNEAGKRGRDKLKREYNIK